jgi:hypothetical protein
MNSANLSNCWKHQLSHLTTIAKKFVYEGLTIDEYGQSAGKSLSPLGYVKTSTTSRKTYTESSVETGDTQTGNAESNDIVYSSVRILAELKARLEGTTSSEYKCYGTSPRAYRFNKDSRSVLKMIH